MEKLEDRLALATAFGLSGTNLLSFDTASPTITQTTPITGVNAGETLVGIDFRPQNGHLYSLGVTAAGAGTLYNVSIRTGVATPIGAAGSVTPTAPMPDPSLATTGFAFDFNPLVDRIRVLTSAGQSFALDQNTGLVVANAPLLNGGTTTADGTGYTNNLPNATATTLYTIDSASDTLYLQNPGTSLTTAIGTGIGFDFTRVNGFDIPTGVNVTTSGTPALTGSAFAALTVGGTTGLYSINLVNGQATSLGNIGTGTTALNGLAIRNQAAVPLFELGGNGIVIVRSSTAGTNAGSQVTFQGVDAGDTLVGIDIRPQTGQLYVLGVNDTANTATLYLVDPQPGSGALATAVGSVGQIAFTTDGSTAVDLPAASAGYGFDFNPTVDRIRVTTGTGLNFRINPNSGSGVDGDNTGLTTGTVSGTNPDGPINGSGVTGVSATAYTNSFGQTLNVGGPTTLYTLDASSNSLFIQNPPNAGTQTSQLPITLNGIPVDFDNINGFDILPNVSVAISSAAATGFGIAVLTIMMGSTPVSEVFAINLATGAAADLGPAATSLQGIAVGDGFLLGSFQLSAPTYVMSESGPAAIVTVNRVGGSEGTVTVAFNTSNGTATAPDDFTDSDQVLTFGPGVTSQTVSIPLTNDAIDEADETFSVFLNNATGGAGIVSPSNAVVTITDNDPAPTVSVNDSSAAEGSPVTFTFTLSNASSQNVTLTYDTTSGTATGDADYNQQNAPATVIIPPGQTTATVDISTFQDNLIEGNESFNVNVLSTTNATASDVLGVGTIIDDDAPTISINDVTMVEGDAGTTAFTFTVTLSSAGATPITVDFATQDGTATVADGDYVANAGTLTFAVGDLTETITVLVNGDTKFEINFPDFFETFFVNLSNVTGVANLADAQGVGTITNDDPIPTVSIGDATMIEGKAGTTPFVFTVTLSNPSSQAITIPYTTNDGTATVADGDYVDNDGSITFAPGQTTQTITVLVNGDVAIETDETFTVTLNPGVGVLPGDTTGTGTIINDDFPVIPPQPPGTAGLFDDPLNSGDTVLLVTGTAKSDSIVVKPVSGQIRVYLNGRVIGTFSPDGFERIVVRAGAGNDSVVISPNIGKPSELNGEAGNDSMVGTNGPDVLIGGPGRDTLIGLGGDDEITGDDGNDVIDGGAGNDTLAGGLGNDVIIGGSGNDVITGDEGNDVAKGGSGDDEITGNDGNDVVAGDSGNDTLSGGIGNDTVLGGSGNDMATGDEGNDVVAGEGGNDTVSGDDGNDTVKGGAGNDLVFGGIGNDKVFGEAGNDFVLGEDGNDQVYGGAGRDILVGGLGADTLRGEAGDDILVGGTTSADSDEALAAEIFAAWTGPGTYTDRMNAVLATGVTVDEDDAVDTLFGHGNQDWFFVGIGDKVKDKAANEIVT